MASCQHPQTRQQRAACWHRQQSGWHRPQRQPIDQPFGMCAGPRSRTAFAADPGQAAMPILGEGKVRPAPRCRGRTDRTNGKRGSPASSLGGRPAGAGIDAVFYKHGNIRGSGERQTLAARKATAPRPAIAQRQFPTDSRSQGLRQAGPSRHQYFRFCIAIRV